MRAERVDLLDPAGLERVVEGCDAVVHVAALYSYDADPEMIERVNVEGTRNVLDACIRERVRRLVHTSTAGTCGPVPGREATEGDSPPAWELRVPYKRTKLAAERLVLDAARARPRRRGRQPDHAGGRRRREADPDRADDRRRGERANPRLRRARPA